jgi:hypothetical protein
VQIFLLSASASAESIAPEHGVLDVDTTFVIDVRFFLLVNVRV